MRYRHAEPSALARPTDYVHTGDMGRKASDEQYNEQETVRRREAALQRMLKTPPQRHSSAAAKTRKGATCQGRKSKGKM